MLLVGLMFAAAASPGHAASFDCAKAATDQERLICADAKLSDLDDQVAQLYKNAIDQLSPAGAEQFRKAQRRWLAYIREICSLDASSGSSDKQDCLEDEYSGRAAELQKATSHIGPYLFVRITSYRMEIPENHETSDQDTSANPRFGRDFAAYPQIDNPVTAATTFWNKGEKQSASRSNCEEGVGNDDLDYSIDLATNSLISVTWVDGFYCEGAAHGMVGDRRVDNTILSPKPRPLGANLFKKNRPWRRRLTALVLRKLENEGRKEHFKLADLDEKAVADIAVTPDRWSLRPEGLHIQFDSYEIGNGYAAPNVTVPWSALKDVLALDPTKP